MATFEFHGNQVLCDGRKIGWLTKTMDGKRVFMSPRDRAKHYFRIWKGWGLNRDLLEWLKQNGFDEVHLKIHMRETLISKLDDWSIKGISYHRPPFEPQVILPEHFMGKKMLMLSEIYEHE